MEITISKKELFSETIKNVIAISSSLQILSDETTKILNKKGTALNEEINRNHYVKVPLIGDFSAGKSTLLNEYIGRSELLPTSIRPETAVSYELFYAPQEIVQHFRLGKEINSRPIGDLTELDVKPGDIVKVFINNNKIKALNKANIVLVDMPGLDSGIEQHQKAINSYLEEGTAFITLVDIEQGSLKQNTLSFLKEIKEYNLSPYILISKSDKKPESEIVTIKEYVESQVKRYISKDVPVGVVSALNKDMVDLENIISNLDSEKLFAEKFMVKAKNFIDESINSFAVKAAVISQDIEVLNSQLQNLQKEKEDSIFQLEQQKMNQKYSQNAANSILNDIERSLEEREQEMVSVIMRNPEDQKTIAQSLLSIVRPIMNQSFQKSQLELHDNLQSEVQEITNGLNEFRSQNSLLNLNINDFNSLKSYVTNEVQPFTDKMFKNNAKYKAIVGTLAITTSFIAPWLEVALLVLPEVIKFFTKEGETDKQMKFSNDYRTQMIPGIIEKLRPQIESNLKEEQNDYINDLTLKIKQEIQKIENEVSSKNTEHKLSQTEKVEEIAVIKQSIVEMETLKENLN